MQRQNLNITWKTFEGFSRLGCVFTSCYHCHKLHADLEVDSVSRSLFSLHAAGRSPGLTVVCRAGLAQGLQEGLCPAPAGSGSGYVAAALLGLGPVSAPASQGSPVYVYSSGASVHKDIAVEIRATRTIQNSLAPEPDLYPITKILFSFSSIYRFQRAGQTLSFTAMISLPRLVRSQGTDHRGKDG